MSRISLFVPLLAGGRRTIGTGGEAPPPAVPGAFTVGQWTLADPVTEGDLTITIVSLPNNNGAIISDLEYRVDGGIWISLDNTALQAYTISGLGTSSVNIEVRAINSVGGGLPSDIKAETPTGAVPEAFVIGEWTLIDAQTAGDLILTVLALPTSVPAATDLEYKVDAGSWVSLGDTALQAYTISGLTDTVEVSVLLRAVNAQGNGADSDAKLATPTAAATVADAFVVGEWTLTDPQTTGDLTVTISSLPFNGGATITDIEYKIDAGSWVSFSSAALGAHTISGLTDDVQVAILIRSVNSVGNALDSDSKNGTPTAPGVFAVPNQAFTRGVLDLTGHYTNTFSATTGTILSIGTPTGTNVADFTISYAANVVSVTTSGDGLANGPYSITVPCFDGAGQTGNQDNVVLTITTEADTYYTDVDDGDAVKINAVSTAIGTASGGAIAVKIDSGTTTSAPSLSSKLYVNTVTYQAITVMTGDVWDVTINDNFTISASSNIKFLDIRFFDDTLLNPFSYLVRLTNATADTTFDRCKFQGATIDTNGDYSAADSYPGNAAAIGTATGSGNNPVNTVITRCLLEDLEWGFWGSFNGLSCTFTEINRIYGEFIQLQDLDGGTGVVTASTIDVSTCFFHGCFGRPTDNAGNGPHIDGVQIFAPDNATDWPNLSFNYNLLLADGRGNAIQGFFQNKTGGGHFDGATYKGNLFIFNDDSFWGIGVHQIGRASCRERV